jgi:hypothetical protein
VNVANSEKVQDEGNQVDDELIKGIAIAEVVEYIKQSSSNESKTIPVFELKKLKSLYEKRLTYHGCNKLALHSTRFKETLLLMIPQLHEYKKGRDVILTLKEGSGQAIFDTCDLQDDGFCLTRAAKIIRKELLRYRNKKKDIKSDEFSIGNERNAVSTPIYTFINMILNESNLLLSHEHLEESNASLTICQLLQYNIKRNSTTTKVATKRKSNETPLPLYIGLMIHSKTRKKTLIEELSEIGLSVPYQRILDIQTQITKQLCKYYQDQQVVCPPRLQEGKFTVAAIDNLDHNATSSTASNSFHGTGISIFQHTNEVMRENCLYEQCQNDVDMVLPSYYTTVQPTKSQPVSSPMQTVSRCENSQFDCIKESYQWLEAINKVISNQTSDDESTKKVRVNWSAFNSNNELQINSIKTVSVMLPLLEEEIASNAMVRHTIDIISKVYEKLRLDQVPIITSDQPVYAISKQVQWLYPEKYGEDKYLMMMGPLHIEMAFAAAIGDWLESSGWVEIIIKSEINTPGRADSLLTGKHPKRSR